MRMSVHSMGFTGSGTQITAFGSKIMHLKLILRDFGFFSSIAMSSVHRLHLNFLKAFSIAILINFSDFESFVALLRGQL